LDGSNSWEQWYDLEGVKVSRQLDGELYAIRGESLFSVPARVAFEFFVDATKMDTLNPAVVTATVLTKYSSNCWARLVQLQRVEFSFSFLNELMFIFDVRV
jgi:hypothetical protein